MPPHEAATCHPEIPMDHRATWVSPWVSPWVYREQRKRLADDVSFLESPAVDIPLRVVVLGKPPLNGPRGEVSIRLPGDRILKCLHPKPIIEAAITEALLAAPIALPVRRLQLSGRAAAQAHLSQLECKRARLAVLEQDVDVGDLLGKVVEASVAEAEKGNLIVRQPERESSSGSDESSDPTSSRIGHAARDLRASRVPWIKI
eukprot:CAMPEP_0181219658 /NCGR_PEP_ID=MMETSP1096-20121128/28405_1 /TAXON_ID=156174 ORGANISM="Chrysochromulina ericina, Strain CCMP281" /NCGR_SAMPLE_ID=MMETSP1096 /ASSEMBLY_ACC=CAM_ASM_000453 /LENGTH=202 /DNA_ID=CAMNT_0023312077 /DNA_START=285 /DNA_END=895 /DNA_ORIENTATION=+